MFLKTGDHITRYTVRQGLQYLSSMFIDIADAKEAALHLEGASVIEQVHLEIKGVRYCDMIE